MSRGESSKVGRKNAQLCSGLPNNVLQALPLNTREADEEFGGGGRIKSFGIADWSADTHSKIEFSILQTFLSQTFFFLLWCPQRSRRSIRGSAQRFSTAGVHLWSYGSDLDELYWSAKYGNVFISKIYKNFKL